MKLQNKVILVTGAAHGIGRAIVEELALHGACIALTYRHDENGANDLLRHLQDQNTKAIAYHVEELSDEAATKKLFETVIKDFGQIDIVIANASGAGVASKNDDLYNLDLKSWHNSLKDNLLVAITTAKFALNALHKNKKGGKILFIGSVLGLDHVGSPRITAYSAGKAAIHNFAKTIAKAVTPEIIVNVVAPGRCWSKVYDTATDEMIKEKFKVNRHGRPIEWNEIAHAVRMILENDSIIGQVITVDAGFNLRDA